MVLPERQYIKHRSIKGAVYSLEPEYGPPEGSATVSDTLSPVEYSETINIVLDLLLDHCLT